MITWRGWHFPDYEQHYQQIMSAVNRVIDGVPTYQYNKYEAARGITKQRRRAIDVGANVGLWSKFLVKDFQTVEAFEPVPEYARCFLANVEGANLHKVALGEKRGRIDMARHNDGACGDTSPATGSENEVIVAQNVPIKTLDSYEFDEVDLLKIDCEGFELFVLKGALETIEKCKPVIVVEQKPKHGQTYGLADDEAAQLLTQMGARLHTIISGDYIFHWK